MHLAQDNYVVHTLTPDRSDQPFGKAILPGRGWCSRLVPDAHGAQSARDAAAIDPVAIADEVVRNLIPRPASTSWVDGSCACIRVAAVGVSPIERPTRFGDLRCARSSSATSLAITSIGDRPVVGNVRLFKSPAPLEAACDEAAIAVAGLITQV
jgi:hypothetical protein